MTTKQSIINLIDVNTLQTIIDTSNSFKDIFRKLGINELGGGNNRTLYKRIKSDNLSLESLNKNRLDYYSELGRKGGCPKKPLSDILIKNSTYTHTWNLKNRLIKDNVLKNECYICGQQPIHNNKLLSLQLDHINGINTDNRLENLRILCPNCHSQTETYSGKNTKKSPTKYICMQCGCDRTKNSQSNLCVNCYNIAKPKKFDIPIDELNQMIIIDKIPFTQIGKIYGVSDNAIRKRARKLGVI